jgi:two-component system, NarL family, response regulator LiaR
MTMIRVLICDDQTIVVDGLEAILSADPDIEVVGLAQDGAEALEKIAMVNPDLVLMDLKMPGMNGIQATRQISENYPGIKVLVLTTYGADEWVFDAIRSGAAGYLLKGTPKDQLLRAIKGTMAGDTHIDPSVAGKLFKHISKNPASDAPQSTLAETLSDREKDVLRLLAQGLSNAEIAEKLFLSEGTVRNYVSAIFNKLGVTDRTQAAILAIKYGLADLH